MEEVEYTPYWELDVERTEAFPHFDTTCLVMEISLAELESLAGPMESLDSLVSGDPCSTMWVRFEAEASRPNAAPAKSREETDCSA